MPITFFPPTPLGAGGPGIQMAWGTTFEGTPVGQWQLQATWSLQPNGLNTFLVDQTGPQEQYGSYTPMVNPLAQLQTSPAFWPAPQTQVHVQGILSDSQGILDSGGNTPIKWDPTSGLGLQQLLKPQGTTTLNPVQAQQLANADQAATQSQQLLPTFLQAPVQGTNDFLTAIHDAVVMNLGSVANPLPIGLANFFLPQPYNDLNIDLLGASCFPTDLVVDLSNQLCFGVRLNITTIPDTWHFGTPDFAWGGHDLAVIHIMSGGSMIARHGVHTPTYEVLPLPGLLVDHISILPLPVTPPNYQVRVIFADGVCGELRRLYLV